MGTVVDAAVKVHRELLMRKEQVWMNCLFLASAQ